MAPVLPSMPGLRLRPLGMQVGGASLSQAAAAAAQASPVPKPLQPALSHGSSGGSASSARWHLFPVVATGCLAGAWVRRKGSKTHVPRQGTLAKPGDSETPSNAIEEWLLSLDLPTPLKPVLGSSAWASFAASLVQMFVVAGLSALGTLIEQGEPAAFYAQKYPESSGILLMLGFDHMYSSPLFLGLLAWLAASLIACTGTTQLPLAKKAQRFSFRSSAAMKRRGNFLMRMNCPVSDTEAVTSVTPMTRLQQLRRELQSRGFIVRSDDEANPTQLAASRGLLGKFAPMAVHLALLLTLAGNTVGLVFGSSSEVLVGDGGYADIGKVLDAGRRIKGPLSMLSPNKGLLESTLVRVDDFRIESFSCKWEVSTTRLAKKHLRLFSSFVYFSTYGLDGDFKPQLDFASKFWLRYKDDGNIDQFYSKLAIQDARTQQELYSILVEKRTSELCRVLSLKLRF